MGIYSKMSSQLRFKSSNRWHHTVDRLPEFRDEVLVYRKDKRVTTAYLELSDEGQVRWVDVPPAEDGLHYLQLLEVTHWLEFDGKPEFCVADKLRAYTGWMKNDSEEE